MQNLSQPSCTVTKAEICTFARGALGQMREFVLSGKIRGHQLLAGGAGLGDQGREAMIALRPDHDIDGAARAP